MERTSLAWLRHLGHPRACHVILLLCALTLLPALFSGFAADDLTISRTLSQTADPGPFSMPADIPGAIARGDLPWWTDPELEVRFVRPLATLTHRLDLWLWPESPVAMHAVSLVLYLALVAVVLHIYQASRMSAMAVGLATLMFAIDDAHATTVAWIANRNLVLASLFGAATMLVQLRRAEDPRNSRWLGPAFLAAALASSEAGLAMFGYVVAHLRIIDPRPRDERRRDFMSYLVVIALWAAFRQFSGASIHATGFYVDPLSDPWRFVCELLPKFTTALAGQLTLPFGLDLLTFVPVQHSGVWLFAAGPLALVVGWLRPWWRHDPWARAWALGTGLATVVLCTGLPQDRYLLPLGLGASALLARFIEHARRGVSGRRVAIGLLVLHLGLPLLVSPIRASTPATLRAFTTPLIDRARAEGKTTVALRIPSDLGILYAPDLRWSGGPFDVAALYAGQERPELRRIDARRIELRVEGGWMARPLDRGLRIRAFQVGERVVTPHFIATVHACTSDGRPRVVQFEFERRLESLDLAWYDWSASGLETITLPPAP